MKLAIGIPSMDMVHADFAVSLALLLSNRPSDVEVGLINEKSSVIHKARHTIIKDALELGADKILFLDADMVFPVDTIERLLNRKKDIVGCNASTREDPRRPTARDLDYKFIDIKTDMLTKAGYMGLGCMLIDMEVFKKMEEPYFNIRWGGEDFVGEDYDFCEKARGLGYELWCDTKMSKEIEHLGQSRCML